MQYGPNVNYLLRGALSVTEMRMLCWICGKARRDMIRNDNIGESWGSTSCRKKMVEA